jgi:hypothetical protein
MAFEPIDVSTYIDEGATCFCGSHLPYEACHKNKIYRHPAEISADQAKFSSHRSTCPFTDGETRCGKPTIASHSLQRSVALREISEQHHVVGFSTGPNAKGFSAESKPCFQKVPISRVSVLIKPLSSPNFDLL